jgi:hypothetical protein
VKTLRKDIKHIIDLQDAIDYMEAKMATAGSKAAEIIERNKILVEVQLLKKEEDLKCKIQAIGSTDSTSLSKTSPHQEEN